MILAFEHSLVAQPPFQLIAVKPIEEKSMTNIPASGQMLWKLEGNDRVLHLRHHDQEPWRPYEEFPQYFLPDPQGFSKGITTFLALIKKGWTTIKC